MEQLRTFLDGTKHGDFAKRVGISSAYLSQILSGERRPSLDVACAIEDATGGRIPMRSWSKAETPPERTQPAE